MPMRIIVEESDKTSLQTPKGKEDPKDETSLQTPQGKEVEELPATEPVAIPDDDELKPVDTIVIKDGETYKNVKVYEVKKQAKEQEGVKCQFCKGTGKVIVEKKGIKECPRCEGDGYTSKPQAELEGVKDDQQIDDITQEEEIQGGIQPETEEQIEQGNNENEMNGFQEEQKPEEGLDFDEPEEEKINTKAFESFVNAKIQVLKQRHPDKAVTLLMGTEMNGDYGSKKIRGTLAYAGVSLNDRIYLPEELAKGDGLTLPLLLNHSSTAGAEEELYRLEDDARQSLERGTDYRVGEVTLTWKPDDLTLYYEGEVDHPFFQKEVDEANMAVSLGIYYDSDSPMLCNDQCYTVIKGAEFREVSLVYHAGFPVATIEAYERLLKKKAMESMKGEPNINPEKANERIGPFGNTSAKYQWEQMSLKEKIDLVRNNITPVFLPLGWSKLSDDQKVKIAQILDATLNESKASEIKNYVGLELDSLDDLIDKVRNTDDIVKLQLMANHFGISADKEAIIESMEEFRDAEIDDYEVGQFRRILGGIKFGSKASEVLVSWTVDSDTSVDGNTPKQGEVSKTFELLVPVYGGKIVANFRNTEPPYEYSFTAEFESEREAREFKENFQDSMFAGTGITIKESKSSEVLNSSQKSALDGYVKEYGQEDRDSILALSGWGVDTHLPQDILNQVKDADQDEVYEYIYGKVSSHGSRIGKHYESKANEEENIVPFREKEQKGEEPNEDNLVPFRGKNRNSDGKFSHEGMETFDWYQDAGHGWLEVPKSLIKQLGISDQISNYSYQKGGMVYLEEDGDALKFINAYESKFGTYSYRELPQEYDISPIRQYSSYSA